MTRLRNSVVLGVLASIGGALFGPQGNALAAGDEEVPVCSTYAPACDRSTNRECAEVDVGAVTYICHSKADA